MSDKEHKTTEKVFLIPEEEVVIMTSDSSSEVVQKPEGVSVKLISPEGVTVTEADAKDTILQIEG